MSKIFYYQNHDSTISFHAIVSIVSYSSKKDTFVKIEYAVDKKEVLMNKGVTTHLFTQGERIDFSSLPDLRSFLRGEYDNQLMEKSIIDGLNHTLDNAKDEVTLMSLLFQFRKMVIYGPAGGADLFMDSYVFRMKDEDFLTPRNFSIWYATVFLRTVTIGAGEWKILLDAWLAKATYADSSEDSLSPPVLDDLVSKILKNRVVAKISEDDAINMDRGAATIFWLKDNKHLYVPAKVYGAIMEKYEVSARKMRQYVEQHLVEKSSKHVRIYGYTPRFWVFNWETLVDTYPQLKDVKMEMSVEIESNPIKVGILRISAETMEDPEGESYYSDAAVSLIYDHENYLEYLATFYGNSPEPIYCADCNQFHQHHEDYVEHLIEKHVIAMAPIQAQTDVVTPGQAKPEENHDRHNSEGIIGVLPSPEKDHVGNAPTRSSVAHHLIDCTYNSSMKERSVTDLINMLPHNVTWEPNDLRNILEGMIAEGLILKKGSKYSAPDPEALLRAFLYDNDATGGVVR